MRIIALKETQAGERRACVVPSTVEKYLALGAEVYVEAGIGAAMGVADSAFEQAGATVFTDRAAALAAADMVLRLHPPLSDDLVHLRPGCVHVSFLDPFLQPSAARDLANAQASGICLELIPRTTIAQKMDVLSSQASLAGYVAVVLAAERLDRVFPMMSTPAGMIAPVRVFVIGVGVAGLQAIATARRLGAIVEAFDTRAAVEEEVRSLGARFVKVDLGETGQTKDGYATALTDEQLARQREVMATHCAGADVVITTAQVFGRRAPVIVTADMVRGMKPGSIVVDLAVDSGGNVEGVRAGEEVDVDGVRLIGLTNLAGRVPVHASQMLASNIANLVEHFWNLDTCSFDLRRADEIIMSALVTHEGAIVHDAVRAVVEAAEGRVT